MGDWEDMFGSKGMTAEFNDNFGNMINNQNRAAEARSKRSNATSASSGHTYEKWLELGYQVRSGEKAAYKYYGKSIFTADQVD